MRVVSIKCPPSTIDGPLQDNFRVGEVRDVSPNLAILLIAAGWARGETREAVRRADAIEPPDEERRQDPDRRHH